MSDSAFPQATIRRAPGGLAGAQGWSATPDTYFFILYAAFLVSTPFWYGSNTLGAWGFNATVAGLLLVIHSVMALRRGRRAVSLSLLWPETLVFAAVCLWGLFQLAATTRGVWQQPIWDMAATELGRPVRASRSIDPDETAIAMLRLFTSAIVFWLALQLCRDQRRAGALLKVIAVSGAAYAFYGIYMALFQHGLLFPFQQKLAYVDSVTSTFINRNSYATFGGVTLVAALVTTIAHFRDALATDNRRVQAVGAIEALAGLGGLYALLTGFIFVAVLLSTSRAGTIVTIVGVIAAVVLSSRGRSRGMRLGLVVVALVVFGIFFSTYSEVFLQRLGETGEDSAGRLGVYRITVQSLLTSPLFGFGYGTFPGVFPLFRDATVPLFTWDKAHETYLEILQGFGLPFGLAFIGLCMAFVGRCARSIGMRSRYPAAPIAAVAASLVVGLHSLVDFSLQIQAICLTWTAMLGAGVAQSWRSDRDTGHALSAGAGERIVSRLISIGLVVFGLGVAGNGVGALAFSQTEIVLKNITTVPEIEQAKTDAAFWARIPGVGWHANDAVFQAMLQSNDISDADYEEAAAKVLSWYPLAPGYWVQLAWFRGQQDKPITTVEHALDMSYLVESREPAVEIQRIELGLTLWSKLGETYRAHTVDDIVATQLILRDPEFQMIQGVVAKLDPAAVADLSQRLSARDLLPRVLVQMNLPAAAPK